MHTFYFQLLLFLFVVLIYNSHAITFCRTTFNSTHIYIHALNVYIISCMLFVYALTVILYSLLITVCLRCSTTLSRTDADACHLYHTCNANHYLSSAHPCSLTFRNNSLSLTLASPSLAACHCTLVLTSKPYGRLGLNGSLHRFSMKMATSSNSSSFNAWSCYSYHWHRGMCLFELRLIPNV